MSLLAQLIYKVIYKEVVMNLVDLRVYNTGLKKIRLGRPFDGGYVICQMGNYDCFISGGIGGDVSFEEDFLGKFPKMWCHAFDGTTNDPNKKNMFFTRKNIGPTETAHETNLHNLINKHKNLFVKLDIEGGEYPWLNSVSDDQLKRIKQLVIEIHNSPQRWNMLSRLSKIYWLAHLHGNNYGGARKINNVIVPNTLECTYIRKSDVNQIKANILEIPTVLDRSNAPGIPDIKLIGYPYQEFIKLI
jgi:hypothetical protein